MDTRELIERLKAQVEIGLLGAAELHGFKVASYDECANALSSQASEIERLTRERDEALLDRDKFCAIAQDKLADTRLISAGPNGGRFGFDFEGGPIPYIAEYLFQFIGARDEKGPSNYAEIEVQHNTFGAMTLTLQRRSGQTPHQLRVSAEAEAKALREALTAARGTFVVEYGADGKPLTAGYDENALRPLIAALDAALTPKPNKERSE